MGLARGTHLRLFRDIALEGPDMDAAKRADICQQMCRGIARLEDLPPQVLNRCKDSVPLRIRHRTPTETVFWVEKPVAAFRLEADLPPAAEGIDRLHRQAWLIYRYRDGREERLRLGAELFHLLLELEAGFQLGDISSDEIFAQLSIFVQRLAGEDERELMAWNPQQDDQVFRIAVRVDRDSETPHQKLILTALREEDNP